MKHLILIAFFGLITILPSSITAQELQLGADRIDQLTAAIQNKKIALVINQTSILTNGTNLLDTLLSKNVKITKIFAPEHGFRGNADAGETIIDGRDTKTGIQVVSLYGKNHKPSVAQLADTDILIFDIQDVGVRFYTYISTMHYVMEACAENNKECIILDRPNPNDYIAGPVLESKYKSFVGMHPIPVMHGLTVGELAKMINGENWLKGEKKCALTIITMDNWKHGQKYVLPIPPSPNLPNNQSIQLYPSLCFFEGTNISVGRGTDYPFQIIGAPASRYGKFTFKPRSKEGAKNPMHKDQLCYGVDLKNITPKPGLDISYLLDFYNKSKKGSAFFANAQFMDLLAGTNKLRLQIIRGESKETIEKSWQTDLSKYTTIRKKYLLYPDKE